MQGLVLDDLLHESSRLHLVNNLVVAGRDECRYVAESREEAHLLFRLGLFDQIGVRSGTGDETVRGASQWMRISGS